MPRPIRTKGLGVLFGPQKLRAVGAATNPPTPPSADRHRHRHHQNLVKWSCQPPSKSARSTGQTMLPSHSTAHQICAAGPIFAASSPPTTARSSSAERRSLLFAYSTSASSTTLFSTTTSRFHPGRRFASPFSGLVHPPPRRSAPPRPKRARLHLHTSSTPTTTTPRSA